MTMTESELKCPECNDSVIRRVADTEEYYCNHCFTIREKEGFEREERKKTMNAGKVKFKNTIVRQFPCAKCGANFELSALWLESLRLHKEISLTKFICGEWVHKIKCIHCDSTVIVEGRHHSLLNATTFQTITLSIDELDTVYYNIDIGKVRSEVNKAKEKKRAKYRFPMIEE